MSLEPLSLNHRNLLISLWRPLCQEQDIKFAEYNFTNVFLTRRKHNYQLITTNPPFVIGEFEPEWYYIIPTVAPEKLDLKIFDSFKDKKICFFPIPDQWLSFFEQRNFKASFRSKDTDYLFKKDKLKTLAGRNLSSRRNLIHQLESHYQLKVNNLDNLNMKDAKQILEQWQTETKLRPEETDFIACQEAFENFELLSLFGRIVYANQKPIGFTIGKLLTSKTALLHYSKSLHEFKGTTPFLYRDFANCLNDEVEWINLMQDLGIPSLQHAKEAFMPDELLKKWLLFQNKDVNI